MKLSISLRWMVSILLMFPMSACTRGKSKEEKAVATSDVAPTTTANASDQDWIEGRLPASTREGTPVDGGEVTVHMDNEPPSLNASIDSDWWGSRVTVGPIYESLVTVDPYDDPRYRIVPALAERWEISEDKLTYTFFLRRGVKWHDGQPFTAKDVIATFDKIQDETTKAAHVRSYFEDLARYEAVDDFTVRFLWRKPYFMALDAFGDFGIQPAHLIAKLTGAQYNDAATNPINRAPIGTGPFRFAEWVTGEKLVYTKNPDYWGKKAHLDRITFRIVKDQTVALQLAERGELETLERILPSQWVDMANNAKLRERFHRAASSDANYQWIGWNAKRPYFSDVRVRRAMTLLIDRKNVIEKMLYGLYRPTECHFYYRSAECDPAITPLPYDPAAAMALLDEAGWKDTNNDGVRDKGGVPFRFVFMVPTQSTDAIRLGTKMKDDFARAGIAMDVQLVEWSAFLKRLREHEFDATTLLWGGGARSDPMQIWHSSARNGGSNYIDFHNAEADKLITDARVIFDDAQRLPLYRRFGAILHEQQPYTFLWVRPRLALISKRLKGVRESLEFWQWQDWWVEAPR